MTFEIGLTKGYYAIVDNQDVDLLRYRWYPINHKKSRTIYASRPGKSVDGRNLMISLHGTIFERIYGYKPTKVLTCDHWDGNGLNCTRENLRVATQVQNTHNHRGKLNSKSGLKGAYIDSSGVGYQGVLTLNGERQYLGRYDTALEAHYEYCLASLYHFREYANFGDTSPFSKADLIGVEWKPKTKAELKEQRRIQRYRNRLQNAALQLPLPRVDPNDPRFSNLIIETQKRLRGWDQPQEVIQMDAA